MKELVQKVKDAYREFVASRTRVAIVFAVVAALVGAVLLLPPPRSAGELVAGPVVQTVTSDAGASVATDTDDATVVIDLPAPAADATVTTPAATTDANVTAPTEEVTCSQ
jgi:hypothetical protein